MVIIDYHIEMLDVGAADAFIVWLETSDCGNRLVLIDSGNYSDGDVIVEHIRRYYIDHPYIDLAIVSHCDDDHYGGFVRLLEKIVNQDRDKILIREFWINDPSAHDIDTDDVKYVRKQQTVNNRLRSVYSLSSGKNLLDLIKQLKIKRTEKFAKSEQLSWLQTSLQHSDDSLYDCFTIIGPTRRYYESLILEMRNDLEAVTEGASVTSFSEQEMPSFDDIEDDPSAHNRSSMIILFEALGKKYLFTGDAARESFYKILKSKIKLINGVDWLKVPHHGSDHNLDTRLIKYIKPKVAYVSAKEIPAKRNPNVISCLKRNGSNVYATLNKGNIIHNCHRNGYVPIKPL
ncbi:hypothetical protein IKQ19_03575 [Candidatus Saccharibacteria bacterium]|nr:hypothetical protein [Candidatus Saccharibacteria bacterium]